MSKRLTTVNNKIKRLSDKKAQLEEELGLLFLEKEELEDQEIVAICRKNNISLEELMRKINEQKQNNKENSRNEDTYKNEE